MAKGIIVYLLFFGQFLFAQHKPVSKIPVPPQPIKCPEVPYVRKSGDPYLLRDLDSKPAYQGGDEAFVKAIINGVDLSDNGAPKGLDQRIFLSFIVEPDGMLSTFVVRNDPGYGIGEEVVKAAKSSTQNGLRALQMAIVSGRVTQLWCI